MAALNDTDDTKEYAIVRFELTETITAYQFASILGTFEGVYTTSLYVEKAKETSQEETMPPFIQPAVDEELYVKKIDVGTPNFLEVIGLADHLYNALLFCKAHWGDIENIGKAVAGVISTVGGIKGVIELIDILKAGKKDKASTGEIDKLENKLVDLENEIQKLKETGKIDDATFQHKNGFIEYAKTGSRGIITNVTYTFISKK